ncbi:MAG: hypothetical protein JW993_11965 [Sedimentisphaerales bacterium]|nr:hypothetical protein [Sedimentisphaerales bacterium]
MKTKRKTLVVSCLASLLILAGGLVVSHLMRAKPPAPTGAPEQTVEYLASERFARLGADDKQAYVEKIRVTGSETPVLTLLFNPNVSEDQRRRAMENVLPAVAGVIDQRFDEFDRLPAAEQTARLDALIDQLQQTRRDNTNMMASAERLNLVLQYLDPHTRAKIRRHLPALRARMKERGIRTGLPF